MHLSMLSSRDGGGYPGKIEWACLPLGRDFDISALPKDREFDMAAILEDWEKLEMSDLPSW